jgi:hypothetical protein
MIWAVHARHFKIQLAIRVCRFPYGDVETNCLTLLRYPADLLGGR